jgi:hypothetical protein
MNYWLEKIHGDEQSNVDLMTKQRLEASERMRSFYAKRRKTPKGSVKAVQAKRASLFAPLAPLTSWEGVSLYPHLEAVEGVSEAARENVRAIMGNSGWTIQQRSHVANQMMRTLHSFQKRGVFSREKDRQYERFLDEI